MNALHEYIGRRAIGPFNQKANPGQRASYRIDTAARAYNWNRRVRHMPAVAAMALALPYAIRDARPAQWFGNRGGAGEPFTQSGTLMRWIESTSDMGLRFVGWSDEIIRRLGHTGWHCDQYGDSSLRGGVWQLAGKGKQARLVYGYAEMESGKEINPGSACIALDIIAADMAGADYRVDLNDESDCHDAASHADSLAESVAEARRDYDSAYQAGKEAAEASQEALDARAGLLALLVDIKARHISDNREGPAWDRLYGLAVAFVKSIAKARAKRESLWTDCHGQEAESAWLAGFRDELLEPDYKAAIIAMGLRARLKEESGE